MAIKYPQNFVAGAGWAQSWNQGSGGRERASLYRTTSPEGSREDILMVQAWIIRARVWEQTCEDGLRGYYFVVLQAGVGPVTAVSYHLEDTSWRYVLYFSRDN